MNFYSNGKLLLTGEYVILDGATSLAVPTKLGQSLITEPIKENELVWGSFTNDNECWFEARFSLPKIKLISATFNSKNEGNSEFIAEILHKILLETKKLNSDFLNIENGLLIKTKLTFPKNWGLGSSSTLINNIAQWADVCPFNLLFNSFGGSGYDIACASSDSALLYQLENTKPIVTNIQYEPAFKDELFFVHLNKKQNSRDGIRHYNEKKDNLNSTITQVSELTKEFLNAKDSYDLNKIILEHEKLIGSITKQTPVKKTLFEDYFGEIKSLGAWGGDFIMATGNDDTKAYFRKKSYNTIITYDEMVKQLNQKI